MLVKRVPKTELHLPNGLEDWLSITLASTLTRYLANGSILLKMMLEFTTLTQVMVGRSQLDYRELRVRTRRLTTREEVESCQLMKGLSVYSMEIPLTIT
jgi:hypothetical protein